MRQKRVKGSFGQTMYVSPWTYENSKFCDDIIKTFVPKKRGRRRKKKSLLKLFF